MTTFLAIDFGTTNCAAGEISSDLKLQLVPLGNDKAEMPSAIFLKSQYAITNVFNDVLFERRVKLEINKEAENRIRSLELIENQLSDFYNVNKPRLKDPNRIYSSYERRSFRFVEASLYSKAVQYFKDNELTQERARLSEFLPKFRTESEIRDDIKAMMLAEDMESNIQVLKEETFFTALNDSTIAPLIGEDAIVEYTKNPMSGFFMRSPKAFLAVNLNPGQKELFIKVVALILSHIKVKSESFFNKEFEGVVIGRPVNFMGANNDVQNKQAIDIIRSAAIRIGFKLVRFVEEPLAAALVIPQSIYSSREPALVVDVGGGTTDIAYLDVGTEKDQILTVLGISGERTGGNDFDQSIALNKFGPFIGRNLSMLNSIVVDALSTRDIHSQAKFRLSGEYIYQTLKKNLKDITCNRLYHLYVNQLQHQVLLSGESLKVSLSTLDTVSLNIDFLPPDFEINLTNSDVNSCCSNHFEIIKKNILLAIPSQQSEKPVRVFITGGMSGFLPVVNLVREVVPKGSTIRRISALHSIVAGLAVVSRQLSFSESAFDEPQSVRGISISK
jgi:hypothetical chaperone protein